MFKEDEQYFTTKKNEAMSKENKQHFIDKKNEAIRQSRSLENQVVNKKKSLSFELLKFLLALVCLVSLFLLIPIFILLLPYSLWALTLFLYFLPSIVAYKCKKKNTDAIFVLNFFLGWTFIGWVIALVWATTKD